MITTFFNPWNPRFPEYNPEMDLYRNQRKLEKLQAQAEHQKKIEEITEAYLKAEQEYQKKLQEFYTAYRLYIQNQEDQNKKSELKIQENNLILAQKILEENQKKYQELIDHKEAVVNPEKVKKFIDYYRNTHQKNWFVRKYRYRKLATKYIEAIANLESEQKANAQIRQMDWDTFVTGFFESTISQAVRYPFRLLPAINPPTNTQKTLIDVFRWGCHMNLGIILGQMGLGSLLDSDGTQNYNPILNKIRESGLLETYRNTVLANIYQTWTDLKSELVLKNNSTDNQENIPLIFEIETRLQELKKLVLDREYLHKIKKSLRNNEDINLLMLSTAELTKAVLDVLAEVASVGTPLSGLTLRMVTQLTCFGYGFVDGSANALHYVAKRHTNSQHTSKLISDLNNDRIIIETFKDDITPKIENKKQNLLHFLTSDLHEAQKKDQRYALKLETLKKTKDYENYHQIQTQEQWNEAFSETHRYFELVGAELEHFFEKKKNENCFSNLDVETNQKYEEIEEIHQIWNKEQNDYKTYLQSEAGKNLSLIEIFKFEQDILNDFLENYAEVLGFKNQNRVKKFNKYYKKRIDLDILLSENLVNEPNKKSRMKNISKQIENDITRYEKKQKKQIEKIKKIENESRLIRENKFNELNINSSTVKYFSTWEKFKNKFKNIAKIKPEYFGPGQFLVAAVPVMSIAGGRTGGAIEDAFISPEIETMTGIQVGAINAGAETVSAALVIPSLTPLLNPKDSRKYQKITPGLRTKSLGHQNYSDTFSRTTIKKVKIVGQWTKNMFIGVCKGAGGAAKNTRRKIKNNVKNPDQNFSALQEQLDVHRTTVLKEQQENLKLITTDNSKFQENLIKKLSESEIYIFHRKEIEFLLNKFYEKNKEILSRNKTKIFTHVLQFNEKSESFLNDTINSQGQLKSEIEKLSKNEKLIVPIQIGVDRETLKNNCPHHVSIVIENKNGQKTFTLMDPYSVTGLQKESVREVKKLSKILSEKYKILENVDSAWATHKHRITSGYDTDEKLRYASTGILNLQLIQIAAGLSHPIFVDPNQGLHKEIFALQQDLVLTLNPEQAIPKPPQPRVNLGNYTLETLSLIRQETEREEEKKILEQLTKI